MKTKLLRKVKKALKHFDVSVPKISEWEKKKYFVFYRSCIDYYKSRYNLVSVKDKKHLENLDW